MFSVDSHFAIKHDTVQYLCVEANGEMETTKTNKQTKQQATL